MLCRPHDNLNIPFAVLHWYHPFVFGFTTYYTEQRRFAKLLRKIFEKFFYSEHHGNKKSIILGSVVYYKFKIDEQKRSRGFFLNIL